MKKDIDFPVVKDVQVAIARQRGEDNKNNWAVFIINRNNLPLHNVLVTSVGYNNEQKTSTLRHFIDDVSPNSYTQIELIDPSVFHLTNEYWVSFWLNDELYDKRYVFVPDSIVEDNIIPIKILEREGVLHQ
jgi:hypothetical protein